MKAKLLRCGFETVLWHVTDYPPVLKKPVKPRPCVDFRLSNAITDTIQDEEYELIVIYNGTAYYQFKPDVFMEWATMHNDARGSLQYQFGWPDGRICHIELSRLEITMTVSELELLATAMRMEPVVLSHLMRERTASNSPTWFSDTPYRGRSVFESLLGISTSYTRSILRGSDGNEKMRNEQGKNETWDKYVARQKAKLDEVIRRGAKPSDVLAKMSAEPRDRLG